MARAREIKDLGCDEAYASAAAKVVSIRAEELFAHSKGVLEISDIERLHDMRVATRRLRAALEIFEPCFPRKRFRRTLKQVTALADALGERRDRDVSIAFLDDFSEHVTAPDRRGGQMLADGLRDEQAEANDELAPFVSEERLAPLRAGLTALCEEALDLIREQEAQARPEAEEPVDSADAGEPASEPAA